VFPHFLRCNERMPIQSSATPLDMGRSGRLLFAHCTQPACNGPGAAVGPDRPPGNRTALPTGPRRRPPCDDAAADLRRAHLLLCIRTPGRRVWLAITRTAPYPGGNLERVPLLQYPMST